MKEVQETMSQHMPHFNLPSSGGVDAVDYCTEGTLRRFPSGWPEKLDVGVHWLGLGGRVEKATAGQPSQLYSPKRKTLIYFHGWTGEGLGSTRRCSRHVTLVGCITPPCTGAGDASGSQPLAQAWWEAGWNVGAFFWDQLADEPCEKDAEDKVWFDRKGDGLAWRSYAVNRSAGSVVKVDTTAGSVTELCANAVQEAMPGFSGSTVRFVGNAIGAQLAVRCAALLHTWNSPVAPQRLALLEPSFAAKRKTRSMVKEMFSSGNTCKKLPKGEEELDGFSVLATANYIGALWERKRVITEVYRSSQPGTRGEFLEPTTSLARPQALLVNYVPDWCGGFSSEVCAFHAVQLLYFLGFRAPPAPLLPVGNVSARGSFCDVPSASCTDAELRALIEQQVSQGSTRRWLQAAGQATLEVTDDAYVLEGGLPAQGRPTPDEGIEWQVEHSIVLMKRFNRFGWLLGVTDGQVYQVLGAVAAGLVLLPLLWLVCSRLMFRGDSLSDSCASSEFEEEEMSQGEQASFIQGEKS